MNTLQSNFYNIKILRMIEAGTSYSKLMVTSIDKTKTQNAIKETFIPIKTGSALLVFLFINFVYVETFPVSVPICVSNFFDTSFVELFLTQLTRFCHCTFLIFFCKTKYFNLITGLSKSKDIHLRVHVRCPCAI